LLAERDIQIAQLKAEKGTLDHLLRQKEKQTSEMARSQGVARQKDVNHQRLAYENEISYLKQKVKTFETENKFLETQLHSQAKTIQQLSEEVLQVEEALRVAQLEKQNKATLLPSVTLTPCRKHPKHKKENTTLLEANRSSDERALLNDLERTIQSSSSNENRSQKESENQIQTKQNSEQPHEDGDGRIETHQNEQGIESNAETLWKQERDQLTTQLEQEKALRQQAAANEKRKQQRIDVLLSRVDFLCRNIPPEKLPSKTPSEPNTPRTVDASLYQHLLGNQEEQMEEIERVPAAYCHLLESEVAKQRKELLKKDMLLASKEQAIQDLESKLVAISRLRDNDAKLHQAQLITKSKESKEREKEYRLQLHKLKSKLSPVNSNNMLSVKIDDASSNINDSLISPTDDIK